MKTEAAWPDKPNLPDPCPAFDTSNRGNFLPFAMTRRPTCCCTSQGITDISTMDMHPSAMSSTGVVWYGVRTDGEPKHEQYPDKPKVCPHHSPRRPVPVGRVRRPHPVQPGDVAQTSTCRAGAGGQADKQSLHSLERRRHLGMAQ